MNDNDNALDQKPSSVPPGDLGMFSINDGLDSISPDKISSTSTIPSLDIATSQENTRARIALYFTYFFLIAIIIAFVGPFIVALLNPPLVANPLDVSKNLVTEVASVLAGPVGFIVGFYFKQGQK